MPVNRRAPRADQAAGPVARRVAKNVAKLAMQRDGAPLDSAEWEAYFRFAAQPRTQAMKRMLRALPAEPRCGFCGAPFAGFGARIVGPLGYRPSRKNPTVCAVCVESAPPGGTTGEVGVLFADLRGFTSLSETLSPERSSAMLRRFYAHAEKVLLPKAMIDKLIGDEVMALYIPVYLRPGAFDIVDDDRRYAATVMVEHARALLTRVGYGSATGPEFELGIGLDFGEAFIGNIGDEFVRDFTAVGDVVNTAARLQAHAAGGEILLSARLGGYLDEPPGELEHLSVKGKSEAVAAYRIAVR